MKFWESKRDSRLQVPMPLLLARELLDETWHVTCEVMMLILNQDPTAIFLWNATLLHRWTRFMHGVVSNGPKLQRAPCQWCRQVKHRNETSTCVDVDRMSRRCIGGPERLQSTRVRAMSAAFGQSVFPGSRVLLSKDSLYDGIALALNGCSISDPLYSLAHSP
jgi:hypothetical protein